MFCAAWRPLQGLVSAVFFYWSAAPRVLHSFPTRRSSDLKPILLPPSNYTCGQCLSPCCACWMVTVRRKRTILCCVHHNIVVYLRRRRSEEHTSELQSRLHLVCRLLLEKKKPKTKQNVFLITSLCNSYPTASLQFYLTSLSLHAAQHMPALYLATD